MVVAPSTGQTRRYLYARYDEATCTRNSKENKGKPKNDLTKIRTSVRIKVVLGFIYDFLKKYFKLTENDYQDYLTKLTTLSDEKQKNLKIKIHSREGSLKVIERVS